MEDEEQDMSLDLALALRAAPTVAQALALGAVQFTHAFATPLCIGAY